MLISFNLIFFIIIVIKNKINLLSFKINKILTTSYIIIEF